MVELRGVDPLFLTSFEEDPSRDVHGITEPVELEQARKTYTRTLNRVYWIEYRMHRADAPGAEKIRPTHDKWFTDGTPVVVELSH